tara:strand:- start:1530 stop:1841 length:312 start_codon:yes stop_codon:yes gene_type:complete
MKINRKVFNNSLKNLQLDCGGAKMTVDVQAFLNLVTINDKDEENKFEINAPKYEIYRLMLEVVLSHSEEMDNAISYLALEKKGFDFKLAFNTLIENNVLKEIE